jgi:hypothetical protein
MRSKKHKRTKKRFNGGTFSSWFSKKKNTKYPDGIAPRKNFSLNSRKQKVYIAPKSDDTGLSKAPDGDDRVYSFDYNNPVDNPLFIRTKQSSSENELEKDIQMLQMVLDRMKAKKKGKGKETKKIK